MGKLLRGENRSRLSRVGRQKAPRGEETRDRIIIAAIGVFGATGFDGASTRTIAKAAAVNVQAIQYYFESKRGLYIAAADYIAERMNNQIAVAAERTRARILTMRDMGGQLTIDEVIERVMELLSGALNLLVSEEAAQWAPLVVREQMAPTEAFEHLYGKVMGPMLGILRLLVGALLDEDPDSERVGLRAATLIGQVIFFRVARTAALRHLRWKKTGPRETEAICATLRESVESIVLLRDARAGKKRRSWR